MQRDSFLSKIAPIATQPRDFFKDYFMAPYPFREVMGVCWRNIFGPSRKNPCNIGFLPQSFSLPSINPNTFPSRSQKKIGFIGDIMDMEGRELSVDSTLIEFFKDCDFLIGNFEATIANKKSKGLQQMHIPQIIEALTTIFPPEKTYLSVANNHAADFPLMIFLQSLDFLQKNGFHIFGLKDTPFVDIDPSIRIITGTWWANMLTDLVADLHDCYQYLDRSKYNICYPHWGYEMELYPRPYTVKIGDQLLEQFDMVIGHHSHTPQPLITRNVGENSKLIAYSLGDFCNGLTYDVYRYGLVTKITLDLSSEDRWHPINGEWKFVETIPDTKKNSATVLIRDSIPYFQNLF